MLFFGDGFKIFIFLGFLYYTTIRTLTKVDCMLRAMFSGKLEVLTGKVDRNCLKFLGSDSVQR